MSELDEDERAFNRLVGKRLYEQMADNMKLALVEHSAVGRWLTASLLAINGAGALAVFNAFERLGHPLVDGGLFVGGSLAALLSGVANQKANARGVNLLGGVNGQLLLVEHSGEYQGSPEDALNGFSKELKRLTVLPPILGWISAFFFTAGSISTGADASRNSTAAIARCAVAQHDMLTRIDRRRDDAAMLQVLGCRPQGNEMPSYPAAPTASQLPYSVLGD